MTEWLQDRQNRFAALAFLTVALLAVFLRVYRLTDWPIWLDEGFSVFGADQGFAFIWNILPTYETHPPFFTALLRCWILLVGNSLVAVRSLGVIIGLITLPVVGYAALELARLTQRSTVWLPISAMAFAASSSAFIDIARLVRPYYLLIFVYAVGIAALLRLVRGYREDGQLARWPWRLYLISIGLLFWLHNLGAFYVASLGLALLLLIGWKPLLTRHLRPFLVGHLLAGLAGLPALLIMFDQAPEWVNSTWLEFNIGDVPGQVMLLFAISNPIMLVFLGLVCGYGIVSIRAKGRAPGFALLLLAFLPILFSVVISQWVTPVFLPRTLVACSVPMALLFGLGVASFNRVALACGALLFLLNVDRSVKVLHLEPFENWYTASRWMLKDFKPGDQIYTYPNHTALPLRYALRDLNAKIAVRQLPGEVPSHDPQGWYPSGTRGVQSLSPARLSEIANDPRSNSAPTIWLVRLNKKLYDKQNMSIHIFSQKRAVIGHFEEGDIDITRLAQVKVSK
jgi:mannosyltransferase